jgi:F0F1-type ATP synthase assembly protein I
MRADWKAPGGYATLGLEIVLSVLLGFLAGRWLDHRFGTDPYLSLLGFGFGVAAAARFVWRAARRMRSETEHDGFQVSQTNRNLRRDLDDERK